MDRESRRNSILKPSFGQALFDGDEENNYTEVTYTFQRRKSLKRVSFAGRDQIKEFEKHEALVDKTQLTDVFNKLKDVSANNVDMVLESEKENLLVENARSSAVSFENPKPRMDEDDMEITTTLCAFKTIQVLTEHTIVNEVEMEVTTLCTPVEESVHDQEDLVHSYNVAVKCLEPPALGVTMNEVEMSIVQDETGNATCISEEKMEISNISTPTEPTPVETFFPNPCPVSEPFLPEPATSAIVEPVHIKGEEITVIAEVPSAPVKPHLFPSKKALKKVKTIGKPKENNIAVGTKVETPLEEVATSTIPVLKNMETEDLPQLKQCSDISKSDTKEQTKDSVDVKATNKKMEAGEQHQVKCAVEPKIVMKKSELEEKPQIKDFIEEWTPEFEWQGTRNDNELILTKLRNCLTLRLELKFEYLQQNVRHYVVEDVEVETKRGLKNKWARFGLNILENTLEGCALKTKCSTTQDLDKLLQFVQNYILLFEDFMLHGSEDFEWMTDPRTLQIDIENSTLSFEKSNLENLLLIRVTLKLNGVFPLSAADTRIESVIGTINKSELISMISAISPTGVYLLRVAECVDDYLKFPPVRNECGILDSTRT